MAKKKEEKVEKEVAGRKMFNTTQLAKALSEHTPLSQKDSLSVIEILFTIIRNKVVDGFDVQIYHVGNFKLKMMQERMGHNPQTGVKAIIPAHNVLRLAFSKVWKQQLEDLEQAEVPVLEAKVRASGKAPATEPDDLDDLDAPEEVEEKASAKASAKGKAGKGKAGKGKATAKPAKAPAKPVADDDDDDEFGDL